MSGEEEISHAGPTPTIKLKATERANDRHSNFASNRTITLPKLPLLDRNDIVFAMGSCFAEEIRSALVARGIKCVPAYNRVKFDSDQAVVDTLPAREHMNFYNSFTVLQQIQEILGLWSPEVDDYWTIGRLSPRVAPWQGAPNYQDPYRRLVIARTPELLRAILLSIQQEMRSAFQRATAFVFTFGMTEVFFNRKSGKVAGQKPAYGGAGGLGDTERHDSTFAENYANIAEIVRLIRSVKPDAAIIMSVSPVPLARTFGDTDVIVASQEGKAILRAVIGQLAREVDRLAYLPSFEYVTAMGLSGFRDDLRHVNASVVRDITDAFFSTYVRESA